MLKVDVPTRSHLTFSPKHNQMFAVLLTGTSANSPIRYFDFVSYIMDYDTTKPFQNQQSALVKMVPCTDAHWEGFDSIKSTVDIKSLLCPDLGTNFDIFGKISSGKQRNMNLMVGPCSPFVFDTKPCASE